MTWVIIIANIIVFIVQISLSGSQVHVGRQIWSGMDVFTFQFGMISGRFTDFEYAKAFRSVFPGSIPAIFTLFTAMFLHSGWVHLISNLWALWIFGDNVEDMMGHWRFLFFYIITGLAGNLLYFVSSPFTKIPLVGASGAIAGVMGAYLVLFPHAKVRTLFLLFIFPYIIDIAAPIFLGVWFLIQFFNGATSVLTQGSTSGVAYWAHIGGFVLGMLVFRGFLDKKRKPFTN
jgi:membrane associated rhomboid family serine protease